MQGTRWLLVFMVLCGLAGTARASYLLTTDPAQPAQQVGDPLPAPAPNPKAFGNVQANTTATTTVRFRSCSGTASPCAINPGSNTDIVSFTGSPGCAEFTIAPVAPATLPVTLESDGTTTAFNATYTPTNRGADSCTFTVNTASPIDYGTSVTLTGTGIASLLAVTVPAAGGPLTFADQPHITGAGETKTIAFVNNGNAPIAQASLTVSMSATTEFTLGAVTPAVAGFPIDPGETATVPVTFNPTSVGNKTATVTIAASNDLPADPSPVVTVNGRGTQSIATVPASVVFAAGAVGIGRNANLTIMNTGDAPLNINSMVIGGAGLNFADFAFTDHGCIGQSCAAPGVIAAGGMSTFALRCTPGAAGIRGAVMTINSDDGTTGIRIVALKCVGNSLSLGTDRVGPPPTAQQLVTVSNASAGAVTYTVASSAAAEFPVACAGGCANRPLAAGVTETVSVTFQALAAGPRSATLTFTVSGDGDINNAVVNLTGTGTEPTIAVAPSPLAFGDVPVAQVNGATQSITVTNGGTDSLQVSSMSINANPEGAFSFATANCPNGGACNVAFTVNPGAPPANQSTVTIRCDPAGAGDKTANLVIFSDAPTSPTTVPLTCAGTVPDVAVSAASLAFGDQRVGVPSAPAKTFTVSNSAVAHTAPLTYAVTEASTEYSLSCSAPGCSGTLAAGGSLTVSVVFTPTSAGAKSADITVSATNDPDEMTTLVALTGTGREPSIAVAPSPLAFGDVPTATVNGATTALTVTNDGLVPLVVSSMAITGDPTGNFSFATATCISGQTCNSAFTVNPGMAPANQATVTLRCDPTTGGDKTATLTLTSDATQSPTTVPLTCTGTVPDVQVSVMALDFLTQRVGTTGAPAKTFTVANSAAAHTAPLAYSVTESSTQYAITCSAPGCTGTLAPGTSITVSVTFTPTTAGVKMDNITVATPTDPDEPSTLVMLTGTGVEPAVTVDAPSPQPLAIGDVDVNTVSGPGTVTLRNSGTADLNITAVALVGGDAAQFAIASGGTGVQTLASAAGMNTRTWTVTCRPTSIGAKTTTFRATHDAPAAGTQTNITVTCTGRAAIFTPSIVAPAKLDFGQVEVNTDSIARTFTFTNNGNKPGRITMLTSTSSVFVPTTMANLATDIAPGAQITVSVVFHPTTTLVVNEQVCGLNTGLITPACVDVTGDGQSTGLDVSPPVNFGDVRFDAPVVSSGLVTITNTGESSLRVDTITSAGAPFTIVNGPVLPVTLNLDGTATFRVRLTPTPALGTVMKAITVTGVFTVSGAPVSSSITATARITAPQVAMTADTLDFGLFDVDDPGAPVTQSVMIMNTADAATGSDLHIAAPVLTAGAPDFAIVGGAAVTVPPGGSAPLMIRFAPTTAGSKTGQVTLGIDALTGLTYTVTLRGTAVDQNVVCNPGALSFPATVRGSVSAPVDATVTNLDFATGPGTAATLDYTATISGADAGDFMLAPGAEAGTIAGNAMKRLPITFGPLAAGTGRTATLTVSWNDGGPRSCMVTLTGDARLRQISVAPTAIDFGTIAVGSTVRLSEVASTLQLTSNEPAGAGAATITRIAVRGAQAAAFTVIGGDTATELPVGGRAEYDVEFSPGATGAFEADLDVFFDGDPEAQYTLHARGTAVTVPGRGDPYSCGASRGGAAWPLLLGLALALRRRRRA